MLICWEKGYDQRWVIVPDLFPEESQVAWYSMRFGIEGGENRSEAGRMAVASDENARSKASGAIVVGNGGGDPVGGRSWGER